MNETRVIAALYRCPSCRIWWSSQEADIPHAQLIFRMAEQHRDLFPWEDYQGRQDDAEAAICPRCGKEAVGPEFALCQSTNLA